MASSYAYHHPRLSEFSWKQQGCRHERRQKANSITVTGTLIQKKRRSVCAVRWMDGSVSVFKEAELTCFGRIEIDTLVHII